MLPSRRDIHFKLKPESVRDWHAEGAYVTHFAHAMSISFPEGERFFIHTVRHYRDRITDPELQKAVAGFIGQEAMHGREHADYNRLLAESGLPAEALEANAKKFFDLLKTALPPPARLAVTIAQEHFTAIVADLVLTDPRITAGADRNLAALWQWHALEELEHKAVAFDVYKTVMGDGAKSYALRSAGLVLTTVGFMALLLAYQRRMLDAEPGSRTWRNRSRFLKYMFASPALLPRLALPWLRYLRPDFHPWNEDNRHLLQQLDGLVAESKTYGNEGRTAAQAPAKKRRRQPRRSSSRHAA